MREMKWYELTAQYEGSSATVGEVVKLSIHNGYCPDNSLRGYTREEIESNNCWTQIK